MRPVCNLVSPTLVLFTLFTLSACGGSDGNEDSVTPSAVNPFEIQTSDSTPTQELDAPLDSDEAALNTDTAELPPGTVLMETEPLPPFTPSAASTAPGPDDEPTVVDRAVTTVTDFTLVEDPARRIKPISIVLTDANFASGTPEPIISAPNGFDTSSNAAPYFDGISNREVFAGQILEVLYRPLDDDGGLPGMFPKEIPEGGTFVDNLDGTKTFRWAPLQGDIGINSFTVTAVDSENPNYRSEQTILIRVNEPDDPSTIPNFPPVVNDVRVHTVRVGDPVILELKGSDRNSTLPNVEVLDPPAGATVSGHYVYEEITVLHFVPQTPGVIEIDVLARDADDPALTGTRTITLNAEAADAFELPGRRLRDLANERDFLLGFSSLQEFYHRPDGAVYADLAGHEFNLMSMENSMKWGYINPEPGTFRWADADNAIAFAKHYDQVVHGHTMIWYTQLPLWILEAPESTLETHMREFIQRLATRYGDDVAIWDVVNEPIADEGGFRPSIWFNAMGEDYIDIAFREARESDPDGILLLNEYDIAWDTPKTATLFPLLERLQQRGTPIDGVGFQLHIDSTFDDFDEVEANFQRAADMGLDIYVTELDVSIFDANSDEEEQAQVFERILEICLNQPRCKALQIWGFTDQYSWRRPFTPLVLDTEYQVKPAYPALQNVLSTN